MADDERTRGMSSPYTRQVIEWVVVVLFAGIVFAILGCAAALVYWAWTA